MLTCVYLSKTGETFTRFSNLHLNATAKFLTSATKKKQFGGLVGFNNTLQYVTCNTNF